MAITEAQFIALEGNIRKLQDAYFTNEKDYNGKLFNFMNIKTRQFTDYTAGTLSRMSPWQGSVAYEDFAPGYEKQYRVDKYSIGLQIEKNLIEDGEYAAVARKTKTALESVRKSLRYDGAVVYNQAFSTTKVGPDGAALCSATHYTVPTATAQSNAGSYALDYDGLESTRQAMMKFVDDKGDEMLVEGNLIIAGLAQERNCFQLFGKEREAFTSDNNPNFYQDFQYVIHPLITGDKWFMVNKQLMMNGDGINWVMRQDPRNLERDGALAQGDFNTEILSWKAIGRWDIGWTNWFFIYGNNP